MADVVVYSGGRLLTRPELVLIFVKTKVDDWLDKTFPAGRTVRPPIVCQMTSFCRDIVSSAYMDLVSATFSQPGKKIEHGTFAGPYFMQVQPTPVAAGLGPADVRVEELTAGLKAMLDQPGALPPVTADSLYVFCCPGEVAWRQGVTNTPRGGGGFHDQMFLGPGQVVTYAAIGIHALGAPAISHELVEAITDADLSGWKDVSVNPAEEVADLCFPQTASFHGFEVSKFWTPNGCAAPPDDNNRTGYAVGAIAGGPAYCDGGLEEGTRTQFTVHATVNGAPTGIASVQWSAGLAGVIVGPADMVTVNLQIPKPAVTFDLTVTIYTTEGCMVTVTRQVKGLTTAESNWYRRLCQLVRQLPHPVPIHTNPLWDPLRDLATHPLSGTELAAMEQYVHQLGMVVSYLKDGAPRGLGV